MRKVKERQKNAWVIKKCKENKKKAMEAFDETRKHKDLESVKKAAKKTNRGEEAQL